MAQIPSLLVPKLIEKYTAGPRPFAIFMKGFVPRIVLGGCSALLYMYAPSSFESDSKENPMFGIPPRVWNNATWYLCVILVALAMTVISNAMFVAQMALFAKVSDPRIGGTYMTLLNTCANLGFKWTSQFFLFLTDHADKYIAGEDQCTQLSLEQACTSSKLSCEWGILENNTCTGIQWKETTQRHDGFYIMFVIFSLLGVLWISVASKRVEEMQNRSLKEWHVGH